MASMYIADKCFHNWDVTVFGVTETSSYISRSLQNVYFIKRIMYFKNLLHFAEMIL